MKIRTRNVCDYITTCYQQWFGDFILLAIGIYALWQNEILGGKTKSNRWIDNCIERKSAIWKY